MKKTFLATAAVAAVLIGGAFLLPVRAQEAPDPMSRSVASFTANQENVRVTLQRAAKEMGVKIEIASDVQGTVTVQLQNVTSEMLLTNLTRQVDAKFTFENGTIYVRRANAVANGEYPGSAPGGATVKTPVQIMLRGNPVDVREALRHVFRQGNAAYSIAPDVQGKVNANFTNVPFETALTSLLRQVDATYIIEGGVYQVVRRDAQSSPATPPQFPPPGAWSATPPVVVQDDKFLYLISSGKIVKVRKSDLKVDQERSIPVQWGNGPMMPGRGGF